MEFSVTHPDALRTISEVWSLGDLSQTPVPYNVMPVDVVATSYADYVANAPSGSALIIAPGTYVVPIEDNCSFNRELTVIGVGNVFVETKHNTYVSGNQHRIDTGANVYIENVKYKNTSDRSWQGNFRVYGGRAVLNKVFFEGRSNTYSIIINGSPDEFILDHCTFSISFYSVFTNGSISNFSLRNVLKTSSGLLTYTTSGSFAESDYVTTETAGYGYDEGIIQHEIILVGNDQIQGVVRDDQGNPLPNRIVFALLRIYPNIIAASTMTDSEGKYTLTGLLPDQEYSVVVQSPLKIFYRGGAPIQNDSIIRVKTYV